MLKVDTGIRKIADDAMTKSNVPGIQKASKKFRVCCLYFIFLFGLKADEAGGKHNRRTNERVCRSDGRRLHECWSELVKRAVDVVVGIADAVTDGEWGCDDAADHRKFVLGDDSVEALAMQGLDGLDGIVPVHRAETVALREGACVSERATAGLQEVHLSSLDALSADGGNVEEGTSVRIGAMGESDHIRVGELAHRISGEYLVADANF